MALQGTVTFDGIDPDFILGADFSLGHGISPSVCTLTFLPTDLRKVDVGTLSFRFGKTRIDFRDCLANKLSLRIGRGGQIATMQIVDRRWKWRFNEGLDGIYNRRKQDEQLDPEYPRKTPQELAKLCLEAIGEDGADVSQLPNQTLPEVTWDTADPAEELSRLVQSLGCRVVLGLDNKVRILRAGKGKTLPDGGDAINAALAFDRAARPDSLVVVTGPLRVEALLRLEAVGIDTDDSIKVLKKLSYAPATAKTGGWTLSHIGDVTATYTKDGETLEAYDLAEQTVFRMYRVKSILADKIPGLPKDVKLKDIDQILPLGTTLLSTSTDPEGIKRENPAVVGGVFIREDGTNSPAMTLYRKPFSIDAARGIVTFSEPVTKLSSSDEVACTDLFLRTTFNVRAERGGQFVLAELERKLPGKNRKAGPLLLRHPEIVPTAKITYEAGPKIKKAIDNDAEWKKEAKHWLDAAEGEYKSLPTADVLYAGVVKIEPDGAIQQVSWSVGNGNPATTRASRNAEHFAVTPSFAEQQRIEREERTAKELEKLRDKDRKKERV